MSTRISAAGHLPGGDTYALDELQEPSGALSTTFPIIDQLTGGGIPYGGLWGLIGTRGVGVTNLALQIGVDAAQRGEPVVFVNDHVDSGSIKRRVTAMTAGSPGLRGAETSRPTADMLFASWIPNPSLDDQGLARLNLWQISPRLVVLDTMRDSDLSVMADRESADGYLAWLGLWRRWARRWGRCVLVTLRLPADAGNRGVPQAGDLAFAAYSAMVEAVDTMVEIKECREDLAGQVEVSVAHSRRGPAHRGIAAFASPTTLRLSEFTLNSPRLED